jgi:hypothetical protein
MQNTSSKNNVVRIVRQIVGSSDKFEIYGLLFQMHFPPLFWLGKADN